MPKTATPDGPGERVALLSRTTIELRKQLEHAASLSGRSLGQEVERRLERTFDFDYLLGDNETALVLRTIATAVQRFEKASGKSWIEDSETQDRVHEAVSKMVDVLLKVRPEIDDRQGPKGPGLPIDWNDMQMRVGFRTNAIDKAMEALQDYRNGLEQELKVLVRKGRARREGRIYAFRVRALLSKATREDLVRFATALTNCDDDTNVAVAFTQGGMVVHQQGADGAWCSVSSEWIHSHTPTWAQDTDKDLKAWIEAVLKLEPAEPSLRPATSEELAGMIEAPGQLPPSIGDQALFDEAVSGLPLVKAKKVSIKKPRYTIQGALAHNRKMRDSKAMTDTADASPEQTAVPKRRDRAKAST